MAQYQASTKIVADELAAKLDAKRAADAETVLKKDAALQAELNK